MKTVKVSWAHPNSGFTMLFEDLVVYNRDRERIEECRCDMLPTYIEGIANEFSDADIIFDKFYVRNSEVSP